MTFQVGDLVYEQLWSPVEPAPDSTIEERIAHGRKYGQRRLMRLRGIIENYGRVGVTRWWLVDPDRPNDDSRMSWVESDWAVLESAASDVGMLF